MLLKTFIIPLCVTFDKALPLSVTNYSYLFLNLEKPRIHNPGVVMNTSGASIIYLTMIR